MKKTWKDAVAFITGGGSGSVERSAWSSRGAARVTGDGRERRRRCEGGSRGWKRCFVTHARRAQTRRACREAIEDTCRPWRAPRLAHQQCGIGVAGEAHEIPLSHWNRVLDVNVRGVLHGIVAGYPIMVRQKSGPYPQRGLARRPGPSAALHAVRDDQARRRRPEHEPANRGGSLRRPRQRALPGRGRDPDPGLRKPPNLAGGPVGSETRDACSRPLPARLYLADARARRSMRPPTTCPSSCSPARTLPLAPRQDVPGRSSRRAAATRSPKSERRDGERSSVGVVLHSSAQTLSSLFERLLQNFSMFETVRGPCAADCLRGAGR